MTYQYARNRPAPWPQSTIQYNTILYWHCPDRAFQWQYETNKLKSTVKACLFKSYVYNKTLPLRAIQKLKILLNTISPFDVEYFSISVLFWTFLFIHSGTPLSGYLDNTVTPLLRPLFLAARLNDHTFFCGKKQKTKKNLVNMVTR